MICVTLLLMMFMHKGYASPPSKETNATLFEYLAQEKTHLTISINGLKNSKTPTSEKDYSEKMHQMRTVIATNKAKIDSLSGFLDNQKKDEISLNEHLKLLQQMPIANADASIQEKVAKIETLLTVNKKTTELILENLDLANQYQSLLHNASNELQLWKANYDLEEELRVIKLKQKKLNQELTDLYQSNLASQSKKSSEKNDLNQIKYEVNLYLNNQKIALIYQKINSLELQKRTVKTKILLLNNSDTKTLQSTIDAYRDVLNQYSSIETSLNSIASNLSKETELLKEPGFKKSISSVITGIQIELKEIERNKLEVSQKYDEYQTQLKKLISTRQTLSEYNIDSWAVIVKKIIDIPNLFYKYIKNLSLKVYDSYTWLDTLPSILFIVGLVVIIGLFYFFNRVLKSAVKNTESSRFTGYLYDGFLTVLQRNTYYLCLFVMVLFILYCTNISFANVQLLFDLVAVWVVFRVLILIARLALLESISDSSGKDVKLYYRLKWLLVFGGWATALMTFSHVLPLPLILQDLFNRLFMLFILTVSLVAWKSKDVIPYLIRPLIRSKKRYFKNAISILVVLVPITLLTTAIIGLVGFVNLAWSLSRYQAYFLLVLVGYVLIRGLIFDALELFSEWMISSLQNGWLWIEVFLKPLDMILRIVLFLISALILFQLYGWHSDSLVMHSLEKVLQYSILNITGIHITVGSIIEFFILLAIFVWASKWTKEFCYRWLYKNTKDVGIRHSLSAFTQYAVILLGSFVTLHALGLDFSGMSMILGGLAVGMGFGLRDFASNIVGGIMLLIERPVREGDLITIGEYEGQVAHIGIRSMRVASWDNTQVLIPNAETFNKPFTNWTHQDGIIRTVIPIKVSRADDPVMIQQLILDVLAIIPEIVPDPPAQVFLKKIDTALIEFEARYFINIQDHNRVEIRSKVLFAITAQFKAAGIQPPIEPITVELKEGAGDYFYKKQPADE